MSTNARAAAPSVGLFGLWMLTGLAGALTILGLLSIGIFVAPFALALLALSIVLTVRRPESWPSIAGLGLALALGLAWLGTVLATSGPSELSCSGSSDGPTTCTSQGRVVDPNAFDWSAAVPWFVAAVVVALVTVAGYAMARRAVASTAARAAGVGT